ncbi:hypothetical protein ACTWKB_15990 [Bacillus sp. 4A_MP2]
MQLFHYHYWTPFVEETEKAYTSLGFEVKGRFAKEGSFPLRRHGMILREEALFPNH